MKLTTLLKSTALTVISLPAIAEDSREMEAHEHGHGALNIAVEGDQLAMELEVPGFDIVGFEHAAESDADKAAIEAALRTLGDPIAVFALPDAAGCTVSEASAELHGDEDHHDDHDDHDDHADGDKQDEHEEHEEHADHDAHEDHDHEEHAEGEGTHSEFHAEYLLTCSAIDGLKSIDLTYFDLFPNAEELDVQVVTGAGAAAMEATREAPVLDLEQAM